MEEQVQLGHATVSWPSCPVPQSSCWRAVAVLLDPRTQRGRTVRCYVRGVDFLEGQAILHCSTVPHYRGGVGDLRRASSALGWICGLLCSHQISTSMRRDLHKPSILVLHHISNFPIVYSPVSHDPIFSYSLTHYTSAHPFGARQAAVIQKRSIRQNKSCTSQPTNQPPAC